MPGCAGVVRNGVCTVCGPKRRLSRRQHDEQRGSAAARGYGHHWRKVRAMQLRRSPFCEHCARDGKTTVASEVDHIVARRDGGSDAFENLQSLCKSCHSKKTAKGE